MLLFINNYLQYSHNGGGVCVVQGVPNKGLWKTESVEESSYTDEDNSEPRKEKIFYKGQNRCWDSRRRRSYTFNLIFSGWPGEAAQAAPQPSMLRFSGEQTRCAAYSEGDRTTDG